MKISVTILTKNSCMYLEKVLNALQGFDEILIYDTGSTDDTIEIAKRFPNVTIKSGPLKGFGPTHNLASSLAKNDWILSIDSDEIATEEMVRDIQNLALDPQCVYRFPRRNYFRGKWIKWCGWHPDRQKKLYHRKNTQFSDAKVHETILSDHMKLVDLDTPLLHYSYHSTEDFLAKMQSYSSLFAEQNQGKKRSSVFKAIVHGIYGFFKSYILQRGFMGGYEGFAISINTAHTALYKYLKLYERNKNDS